MGTKVLIERYARYYEFLQRLGSFDLSENPTIEEIKLSKGIIQSGYKEMKEANFKGNLIDYLCWISMHYQVSLMEKSIDWDTDVVDCVLYLKKQYWSYKPDISNLLRLVVKNPDLFFDLLDKRHFNEDVKKDIKLKQRAFEILAGFWYLFFIKNKYYYSDDVNIYNEILDWSSQNIDPFSIIKKDT